MDEILRNYLSALTISAVQTHQNLSLFQLFSDYRDRLDYLTLEDALSWKLATVTEVSESGLVPQLRISNLAELPVLIIDGEELVGAKQNRVVNTTILIADRSTTEIPVSCVEQGRWSYQTHKFKSENRLLSSKIRAGKAEQVTSSLKKTGRYTSDQQAIWGEIKVLSAALKVESPSMEMGAIYRKERRRLDGFTSALAPVDGQLGAVFVINGRIAGLEAFGKPEIFARVFRKLVESYALEATNQGGCGLRREVEERQAVDDFMRGILSGGLDKHPSVGLGTDVRLEAKTATGFALVHKEQLLHLSVFEPSRQ